MVLHTKMRDTNEPPILRTPEVEKTHPNGICRSHFERKAVPCAQGKLFPLLSRDEGCEADFKFDIPTMALEVQKLMNAGGGVWQETASSLWAVTSISAITPTKIAFVLHSTQPSLTPTEARCEVFHGRRTSTKKTNHQDLVVEVNETVAALVRHLPVSIWRPVVEELPESAKVEGYRLTSANIFGGFDLGIEQLGKELNLIKLAEYIDSPKNAHRGKVRVHRAAKSSLKDKVSVYI